MYQSFNNKTHNNQNDERLWLPFLAGAAIISAPFWFGIGRNNNNNCCPYPVPYYPQPYYPQPYPISTTNYYY